MRVKKDGLVTMRTVELTGSEFYLEVKSTDGRVVAIAFSSTGDTTVYCDDAAIIKRDSEVGA
jgi:hypothetical protein